MHDSEQFDENLLQAVQEATVDPFQVALASVTDETDGAEEDGTHGDLVRWAVLVRPCAP